jgi:hypothetical protein
LGGSLQIKSNLFELGDCTMSGQAEKKLIIRRKESPYEMAAAVKIFLDDIEITTLKNGEEDVIDIKQGNYSIYAKLVTPTSSKTPTSEISNFAVHDYDIVVITYPTTTGVACETDAALKDLSFREVEKEGLEKSSAISRKFQIIKTVLRALTILIFLAIPVVSFVVTVNNSQGGCFFGAPCSSMEFAWIIIPFILLKFIPFLVPISLVWIVMSVFQSLSRDSRKSKWIQAALLVLVLLTISVLSSYMINGLKVKYSLGVENKTSQILYLTVVTTNHGSPKVVSKRNIPIRPQSSVDLVFNSTDDDAPLARIAVCRTEDDCRLLPDSDSYFNEINSYESLERLNPSWLAAIRSSPLYNNSNLIIMALSLVPILLLSGWLYLI